MYINVITITTPSIASLNLLLKIHAITYLLFHRMLLIQQKKLQALKKVYSLSEDFETLS